MSKFFLLYILLVSLVDAKYFNTNPLIERGVDPQILNLGVTIYKQNVAYEIETQRRTTLGEKKSQEKFKLLYDPFQKYGIDIRIMASKEDLKKYDTSEIKKELDQIMGLQSYLQAQKLYKLESIKYIGKDNQEEVFSFDFDTKNIPRELQLYRSLYGKVYIKNRVLQKIVIKNFENFHTMDIDVKEYTKTLTFTRPLHNRGYLLKSMEISIKGTKEDIAYSSNVENNFVHYWDSKHQKIHLLHPNPLTIKDYKNFETINVDLDRTLPFYGQEIRKMGYDLPKPFGVSLVTMYQETRFYMDGVSVDRVNGKSGPGDVSRFFKENSKYENATYATLIRADMWVLPFLNFSLLFGGTSTSTDINLDLCLVPSLGCPAGGIEIPGHVNTNSILYGAGATIGGGIGNFFSSVDFQYMISYTDTADVETQINIITPIFGYYFQGIGLRAYGGAMYEDLKEEMGYKVSQNATEVEGTIKLRAEKWAGTLGAQYAFSRNWEGNILGAYGEDFQNLSLVVTYRW
jgi:hypothetical protein